MTVCVHFGTCGGCSLQGMDAAGYAAHKKAIVETALAKAGVAAKVLDPLVVPANTRRRAVFKIRRMPRGLHIGFHAAKSHTVVDMRQCMVLTPGLFALVGKLRARLEPLFAMGEGAELHVTETASGFDAALRWKRRLTAPLGAELAGALGGIGIARLTMNGQAVFGTAIPTVAMGAPPDGVTVALPPGGFLQATAEGEAALLAGVRQIVGSARTLADLFAGCGTFSLPLARGARVHAVEKDGPALAALAAAARAPKLKPVTTEARDLFALPLTALELSRFEAVVLDPPRAGAEKQVRALAASKVARIAYVSCDAASFARDAAILAAGGYAPGAIQPIDQFLWSSHIELVAAFTRDRR